MKLLLPYKTNTNLDANWCFSIARYEVSVRMRAKRLCITGLVHSSVRTVCTI
jgi:hypothetical protein